MIEYSYVRYLRAKRTVDDRALNRPVLEALKRAVQERGDRPLRVLELGAGVGTMLSRLLDWGVLGSTDYVLLDRNTGSLAAARQDFMEGGARVESNEQLSWSRSGGSARVEIVHAEARAFLSKVALASRFDLVIANAFLDLTDLNPMLGAIWGALEPGGLFWSSINFDGATIFLPQAALDEAVLALYHRGMDERVEDGKPAGHSQTGRRLLAAITETGGQLAAAGSSDWVVFPAGDGYVADEAYFLHHIVHTISEALQGHTELQAESFAAWVAERHAQIERHELIYVAHQLDVFGFAPRGHRLVQRAST